MANIKPRLPGTVGISLTTRHAAASAIAGCLFASSAAFASPPTKRIIVEWEVTFELHQANPPDLTWGDTLQATYVLTEGSTGTADFACTVVAAHFLCQGIIRLPEGDIYALTGPLDDHEPAAIIGGTRAFVGVTGQFTQQETSDDTGKWALDLRRLRQDD